MLKFTAAWTVRKLSGTEYWIVAEPFVWWIIYGAQGPCERHVIVPGGFSTNFGSIPRFFWWIINPTEWNAYVLHDYLYSSRYNNDRHECDLILYEALVAEGCSKPIAAIIYFALFLFGAKAWNAPTKSVCFLPNE